MPMGYGAKSSIVYISENHVIMQLIIIPQLARGLHRERDGGMIQQRDRVGI